MRHRFLADRPRNWQYSLRSLLGAHGIAAAAAELAYQAPLVAGLIGIVAGFALLQLGVLAACTWRVPRIIS
jgi:hypothetical protein